VQTMLDLFYQHMLCDLLCNAVTPSPCCRALSTCTPATWCMGVGSSRKTLPLDVHSMACSSGAYDPQRPAQLFIAMLPAFTVPAVTKCTWVALTLMLSACLPASLLCTADIKPQNVLLADSRLDSRGFTALLSDFGWVTVT
jgi:hypothetical protein